MKIAKRIYFCVLPLLLVLVLVFSFVHIFNGGRSGTADEQFLQNAKRYSKTVYDAQVAGLNDSATKNDDTSSVRKSIETILSGLSINKISSTSSTRVLYEGEDGDDDIVVPIVNYSKSSSKIVSNWYVQTSELTSKIQAQMANDLGLTDYEILLDRTVNNIVVNIPGQNSKDGLHGDVILFTVHMDSPKLMSSGVDASTIGVALAQIFNLVKGEKAVNNPNYNAIYENDIVFLFTDARYDASVGVRTFLERFYGFAQTGTGTSLNPQVLDLVSRISLAVNLDSLGIGNSGMILQTSDNNSKLISEFKKALGGTVSSSYISDYYSYYASDFNAFKSYENINAVNLVTFGQNHLYSTAQDNYDNISDSVYKAKSDLIISTVTHFGSMDLSSLNSTTNSVYYSFLGLFTISFANYVSYILGFLILGLIGTIIGFNIKNKGFSFKNVIRASVVQILSIIAVISSMFVLYFVISLILSGLGLYPIQAITNYVYSNTGIILGWTFFIAIMFSLFYTIIRKRIFKNNPVSALSLVRAGIFLFSLIGLISSFTNPSMGYMFAIPSILFLGIMLSAQLVKRIDFNKYYFYLIPFAIGLCLIIPVTVVLALNLRAVLTPILFLPMMLLALTCTPYTLLLIKPLDSLLMKLPKRTIRVLRMETVNVEDKAKPGKFTQKQVKQITNEKIDWRYRHGVGSTVIASICVIVIMACSALSVPFGANSFVNKALNQPFNQYTSNLYQDSLILSWKGTGETSEVVNPQLQIHDKGAFKYFNYALNGYSWDSSVNAYVKDSIATGVSSPSAVRNGSRITVMPTKFGVENLKGVVEIYFHDIGRASTITVYEGEGTNEEKKHEIDIASADTLTLKFPLDGFSYETIGFSFTPRTGGEYTGEVKFTVKQYVWDYLRGTVLGEAGNLYKDSTIAQDVRNIFDYFKEDEQVQNSVRFGLSYEQVYSINFNE